MSFWENILGPTSRHHKMFDDSKDYFTNSNNDANRGSNDGSGGGSRQWGKKPIQGHLPLGLQWWTGGGKSGTPKQFSPFAKGLMTGAGKLGDLMANPGGFGGNIAEAIAPRVAMESEMINRNTQGQASEAAGGMARSGTGGGFAQALQASIAQAGAREKATSVRTAQMDSAELMREDADRVMSAYSMLLDWYKPKGRQGTGAASRAAGKAARGANTSAGIGAVGTVLGAMAQASDARLKEDITPIKPVSWTWKSNAIIAGKVAGTKVAEGLLAQDVEKVWPDAVVTHPAGYLMVNYQTVASRLAGIVNAFKPKASNNGSV